MTNSFDSLQTVVIFASVAAITYITGDVTEPLLCGNDCIVQVVNNVGAYGAGVSGAIAKKWPSVKQRYKDYLILLGNADVFGIGIGLFMANLYAQDGLKSRTNPKPIRYGKLAMALSTLELHGFNRIHMPKIGCGLAGGDWKIVSELIQDVLVDYEQEVYVYELPDPKSGTGKQP